MKPQGQRRRWFLAAGVVGGLAVVLGAVWGLAMQTQQSTDPALSCHWAARIHGSGIQPGQDGAVRCYLKALASGDAGQMTAVMPADGHLGPVQPSAFALSADARHGTATVFIIQNGSSTGNFDACIRFADGKAVDHGFALADPTDGTSWRVWDANQSHETVYSPASNPDDPCMTDGW